MSVFCKRRAYLGAVRLLQALDVESPDAPDSHSEGTPASKNGLSRSPSMPLPKRCTREVGLFFDMNSSINVRKADSSAGEAETKASNSRRGGGPLSQQCKVIGS